MAAALGTMRCKTSMIYGKAMFALGPAGDANPVGVEVIPHAWAAINRHGFFDLSPDFRQFPEPRLKGLGHLATVLGTLRPRGRMVIARTAIEYENEVALATHAENGVKAIYLPESFDDVTKAFVLGDLFAIAHSPLVDELRQKYSSDILAKATRHLIDLARGKTKSLRFCTQEEAWARLDRLPGTVLNWISERLSC